MNIPMSDKNSKKAISTMQCFYFIQVGTEMKKKKWQIAVAFWKPI